MSALNMATFSDQEHAWMRAAIELAERGRGWVEPNPMVGCVLVLDGEVVAAGFHRRFGGPHAEREAIFAAGGRSLAGGTAYVTLEPCCHFGKTPPCTDALIEAGLARVVVGMLDPFSQVAGQGIERLRSAGLQVDVELESELAQQLNAPYCKRIAQSRPWVIAKWAMTLDGKIATREGHSQWISGEASRRQVHQLRAQVDAIIVGIGTALADDPLLTARPAGPRIALRIVVDSTLRIPVHSRLVKTARDFPLLVWAGPEADAARAAALRELGCRVEFSRHSDRNARLDDLLKFLVAEFQATNVLVESGGEILGSLFDLQQIDQCEVFIAAKLIGGSSARSPIGGMGLARVDASPIIEQMTCCQSGDDIHISCRPRFSKPG